MPKYKFKLTRTFQLPADVEFEVEFDTETGEAEVVSNGRVVASEDHMRRRQIIREAGDDDLDESAYVELLRDGTVEFPKPGAIVFLHGDRYVMDTDPDYFDPDDPLSPESVPSCLSEESLLRRSARRRGKLSI